MASDDDAVLRAGAGMKVYVGQSRGAAMIRLLTELGWGEMTTTRDGGSLPPRRRPWAFDNGAYSDWTHGRAFNAATFERDVDRIARDELGPDFIVTPDIVTGGLTSLAFSVEWVPRLRGIAPLYLAVQDGMTEAAVVDALEPFAGIFVGGSNDWKVATGAQWVRLAHAHGRKAHIGRAGTENKAEWAKWAGADSIDSCFPLWTIKRAHAFKAVLEGMSPQPKLGDWGRAVAEGMGAR